MKNTYIIFAIIFAVSCKNKGDENLANGTFENTETIISSQTSGRILSLNISEGSRISAGTIIGFSDTTLAWLRVKQLEAQIQAVLSKRPDVALQLRALETQLAQAKREQKRLIELAKGGAATGKQLDDAASNIEVIEDQIAAQHSILSKTSGGLEQETHPLRLQLEQAKEQLRQCFIMNPVNGIVFQKYCEIFEITSPGKPIYKIANPDTMILRAYITADQYNKLKPGAPVKVFADAENGKSVSYPGTVTWLSSQAEFTPKTIQTRDERSNLVYAIKVKVPNPGNLKSGMYGSVQF